MRAGVLLAHVLEALEVAGQVLDLPTLLGANLFSFRAAARAGALGSAQFIDVGGHGQVGKIGQRPPSPPPLHPP
jgi:hypothetical protein